MYILTRVWNEAPDLIHWQLNVSGAQPLVDGFHWLASLIDEAM